MLKNVALAFPFIVSVLNGTGSAEQGLQQPARNDQPAAVSEDVTNLREMIDRNTSAIARIAEVLREQVEMTNETRAATESLRTAISECQLQQQHIVDSLAGKEEGSSDILRLSYQMETKEEFRNEFRKAVHDSLQSDGCVTVVNNLPSSMDIIINSRTYNLGVDEQLSVRVPVGTATTQLAGQPVMTWYVGPPDYDTKILIQYDNRGNAALRLPAADSVDAGLKWPWINACVWKAANFTRIGFWSLFAVGCAGTFLARLYRRRREAL